MAETIPPKCRATLEKACSLHERTTSDYQKCLEFNASLSTLLADLEDAGCTRAADQIMSLLMECLPKEGSSCEKSAMVGDRVQKILQRFTAKT